MRSVLPDADVAGQRWTSHANAKAADLDGPGFPLEDVQDLLRTTTIAKDVRADIRWKT